MVRIKRVYDRPSRSDGMRILVDRVWPRGVSKADAKLDAWRKELAPSAALRRWFGHDPAKWTEFRRRYRTELDRAPARQALEELRQAARSGPVTLVYGARDERHNQARVLQEILEERSEQR